MSARNGAKSSGSDSISATSQEGTPSSTIITRFSVPMSSTAAMPTVTWNSESRSRRGIGSSAEPASAKGRMLRTDAHQAFDQNGAGAVHERRASTACEM